MWSGWWVQDQAAKLRCFRHSVFCDRLFILWDRTDCVQKNMSVGVKWTGGVSVGRSQTFWELQSSEKLRLGWGAHTFLCGAPILLFTVSTWNLYLEDFIHQTCSVYGLSRQHIKMQRHHFANKCPYSQSYAFSSSHVQMWELDRNEGWAPKNWCFWTEVLEKTLESHLESKEIKPINLKGN